MKRYRMEFDMNEDDCSFCPWFEQNGNDGLCTFTGREMRGVLERSRVRGCDVVLAFDMPDDCPLEEA